VSTALVVHSGGPTAVINASLLGIVEAARTTEKISSVLGARGGLTGLLRADFVDLLALPQPVLSAVGEATSSALGTSRHPVSDDDFDRARQTQKTAQPTRTPARDPCLQDRCRSSWARR